jgi:hypothetical protein
MDEKKCYEYGPEMCAHVFEILKFLLGAASWQHPSTIQHLQNLYFIFIFKMFNITKTD